MGRENGYIRLGIFLLTLFVTGYLMKIFIDGAVYTAVNAAGIYSAAACAVRKLASVFSVLIGGFVIAYIFDPAVDFLSERFKIKKRRITVRLLYLIMLILFVSAVWLLYMYAVRSGRAISSQAGEYCRRIENIYLSADGFVKGLNIDILNKLFDTAVSGLSSAAERLSQNIMHTASSVGGISATVFLSFVVSYYFLIEKNVILEKISIYGKVFLPEKIYTCIKNAAADLDYVFSGYLRGQAADALIMAVLISMGLTVLKVRFSVVIGLVSGFSNIIPYFGAIMGFVLAVSTAFICGEPAKAVYAAIFLIILQQIDSVFIVPRVVGSSVKLSPAAIILALAAAGRLFGFAGLVLAVPAAAAVKVVIKRIYVKKCMNKAV